jgi:hypothetical protein
MEKTRAGTERANKLKTAHQAKADEQAKKR